jgi:TMEM175 potassium channel family protein
MSQQLHNELKKEFQLERMILFSDAVFAIAITILVIEIRVPEIPKELVTEQKLLESLDHLIPKFVGFLISFMIIGLYWQVHHRMFGFVVNYTRRTLWLNLFFLLAVVLMPFSTAFYSEYVLQLLKTPIIVYVVNICFLGFMNFFLWKHLTNPKLSLTEGVTREEDIIFSFRSIAVPLVFIVAAFVYLFNPMVAAFLPSLLPLLMRIITKRIRGSFKNKRS